MYIRTENTETEIEHQSLIWLRTTNSGEIYWECLNISTQYTFTEPNTSQGGKWEISKDDGQTYSPCEKPELETLYQQIKSGAIKESL